MTVDTSAETRGAIAPVNVGACGSPAAIIVTWTTSGCSRSSHFRKAQQCCSAATTGAT